MSQKCRVAASVKDKKTNKPMDVGLLERFHPQIFTGAVHFVFDSNFDSNAGNFRQL